MPVVCGMQGYGVRTPSAAAVAAATCGFARDVHIPNGCMFDFGGDDNEAYFSRFPAFGERNKNALTSRGEPPLLACSVIDVDAYVDDGTIND